MTDPLSPGSPGGRGFTARVVAVFLTSRLSLLFLLASFLAGALALAVTPREEEPQIVVPVADVIVEFPGASAEETEKLVSTPLEGKLWEIDGVEYVYSVSRPGTAVVTVRFYVGENREDSLVKTWNKVMSNQDVIPPGVASWIVKPVEIDDVPIVLLALWSRSGRTGGDALRRIGDEILDKLAGVRNAGRRAAADAGIAKEAAWTPESPLLAGTYRVEPWSGAKDCKCGRVNGQNLFVLSAVGAG